MEKDVRGSIKEFIVKTMEFYNDSRRKKDCIDRAVRQSGGVLLYKIDDNVVVEYPGNNATGTYDDNISSLLEDDIMDFIVYTYPERVELVVNITIAHFIRVMSIGSTIDVDMDILILRDTRYYLYRLYRLKIKESRARAIIRDNVDILLSTDIPKDYIVPDCRPTSMLLAVYEELVKCYVVSRKELAKLQVIMTMFVDNRGHLSCSFPSDVEYGLLRVFMKINHRMSR